MSNLQFSATSLHVPCTCTWGLVVGHLDNMADSQQINGTWVWAFVPLSEMQEDPSSSARGREDGYMQGYSKGLRKGSYRRGLSDGMERGLRIVPLPPPVTGEEDAGSTCSRPEQKGSRMGKGRGKPKSKGGKNKGKFKGHHGKGKRPQPKEMPKKKQRRAPQDGDILIVEEPEGEEDIEQFEGEEDDEPGEFWVRDHDAEEEADRYNDEGEAADDAEWSRLLLR